VEVLLPGQDFIRAAPAPSAAVKGGAALDAGVDATIKHRPAGAPDHPVRLAFPEGGYLKGLVMRKLEAA
jgi:hypothetical protein